MPLLNLHAHSLYSDGSDGIEALAVAFKANKHAALIITDHDDIVRPIALSLWDRMLREAEETSKNLGGYPILVGLEIYISGGGEECLLFGYDACREWLSLLNENTRDELRLPAIKNWIRSLKDRDIEHALILCHPTLRCIDSSFYALLDGYEIMNSGQLWSEDYRKRMAMLMPKAKSYKNLDLHGISDLKHQELFPCNEITEKEKNDIFKLNDNKGNMSRLITWIKTK